MTAQQILGRLGHQFELQRAEAEKLATLFAGRERTIFGNPDDVLGGPGNIFDVAYTGDYWHDDIVQATGAMERRDGYLEDRSATHALIVLQPRETCSMEVALSAMRATCGLYSLDVPNIDPNMPWNEVTLTLYDEPMNLFDALQKVLSHGWLHLGQAWGIAKAAGLA